LEQAEGRHSDSLKMSQFTLSQGKMKKGDDVTGDEDDDAVRTSVSQDQVTATLCTEELFLRTRYYIAIYTLSTHQTGQMIHLAVPAGFHTSQLDLHMVYRVSDKCGFFCTIIL
jgi:hypothetical protein